MKKILLLIICCFALTGCNSDPELTKFKNEIDTFCSNIAAIDTSINNITVSNDEAILTNAKKDLLEELNKLDDEFKRLANLSFPEEFKYLENLSDEASKYMSEAVTSYTEIYGNEVPSTNKSLMEYANENYSRANKRITIILSFIRGEVPDDPDLIIQ